MTSDKLISREEALGGLRGRSAKRASTLLTLIENRTARLVDQSQPRIPFVLAETTLQERNRAFLEAMAMGREAPLRPTIQDIERYAPHWADLVPDDAGTRATLANLMAHKYRFTYQAVPALRLALGLDAEEVEAAYQGLYERPLVTIYAPAATVGERVRWAWAATSGRLESLPPLLTTFLLTLPGAVGLLALPIALAGVGLSTGIVLVIVFGLINVLTAAALAEAVARSGTMHFGLGFLGQLMHEYLGQAGSALMTLTLALNNFFVLIIFYIGVASTLEDATRLPAEIWVAALFGVCLYFISRRSLNATIATTLIIVLVNLTILLAISLLALRHAQLGNLAQVGMPFANPALLQPGTWQVILGIMLSTYFSHLLVATYGPVVLRREPSGRAWIRGTALAILAYTLICCLWLVAINGAIPSQVLSATAGTVLSPLAEVVGPIIHLLGSVLVILSLGLASVQIALGLYYIVWERMPSSSARLSERGRFWLAASPLAGVFLLTEVVAITGFGTFTSLLGIVSALVLPLLGGIFPALLLAATRRKGDFVPGVVYRLLGSRVVLVALYLFFLSVILIHGLFIWDSPLTRSVAILVGVVVLGATIVMLRRGALESRAVVELRDDQSLGGRSVFNVTDAGQAAPASVQLCYPQETQTLQAATGEVGWFSRLQAASFQLLATPTRQLKVWAHRITPEGDSVSLPARLVLEDGGQQEFDLEASGGQRLVPLASAERRVDINLR